MPWIQSTGLANTNVRPFCQRSGPPRVADPVGNFLILGYQKSSVAPTVHPAGCHSQASQNKRTINDSGAMAGGGVRRFLVPQYEADNPTDCCAANVHKCLPIWTRTSTKTDTKN